MGSTRIIVKLIEAILLSLLISACSAQQFLDFNPTFTPTMIPSGTPSITPTLAPTFTPTYQPTFTPIPTLIPIQNTYTGELIPLARYNIGPVYDLAFSPDGRWLALGVNGGVLVYDSNDLGLPPRFLGANINKTMVDFSPDGEVLAGAGSNLNYIYLWKTSDWGQIRNIGMDYFGAQISNITFAPDGTLVSVSTSRVEQVSYVKLWSTDTGKLVRTLSSDNLLSVALSPDDHTMATGTDDGKLILWNWTTGDPIDSITTDGQYVDDLAFSPDGLTLASTSGKYGKRGEDLTLWDVATMQRIRNLPGAEDHFESITFSSDGETLAACCYKGNTVLWDPITGKSKNELAGGGKLEYSPNGDSLAYGGSFGGPTVTLWNTVEQQEIRTISDIHGDPVIAFTPDGTTFVAYSVSDHRIVIRDLMSGSLLSAYTFKGPIPENGRSKFSRDGSIFVMSSENQTISLWNAITWEKLATFPGVTSDFEVAPDGRTIATLGRDLVIWDISTGLQTMTLTCGRWMADCESVAFSPDGKTILVSSYTLNGNMMKIFDVSTGHELATFESHSERMVDIVFSPDGTSYATIDRSSIITLWDATTYEQIRTFGNRAPGEYGSYRGVPLVFSPDGQVLASVADDRINIWNIATGSLIYECYVPDDITTFSFVFDGTMLVTGDGNSGSILYWGFAENLSRFPFPISNTLVTPPP